MREKKSAVISALSGIVSAIPFIFKDLSLFIFISITPFLYCIITYKKNVFTSAFYYFFSFYMFSDLWMLSIGMNFISNKINGFILSCLIIIAVSLILSITASLPFILLKKIKSNNSLIMIIIIPFIYILGEWIHGIYPLNYPWNRLCNIVAYYNDFVQSVSILGGLFISYIIVLINICFVYSVKFFLNQKYKTIFFIALAVFIFKSNIFLGDITANFYKETNGNANEIMLVQPNFTREEKLSHSSEYILNEYIKLAEKNITPYTKMIIFPETAFSSDFFNNKSYKNKIYQFAHDNKISLFFGISYKINEKKYNSCTILNPNNELSEIYMKRILVPFGEYTPRFLPKNIQFIKSSFSSGEKNTTLKSSIGNIGCAICFESIFPQLVADNIKNDAELLTIISNDSWLGNRVPLYQHHSHSILRALENRKYTITCANTGISSIVSSNGEIINSSMPNVKQTLLADIYCNNIQTFYFKHGDLIIIPALIVFFILTIYNLVGKVSNKKAK